MKVIQYIKINHLFNRVAFASGVILTLLAIAIHLPIISNGEQEAQAATGTAQESSLTLAVERDTAALDLNVASSNGTFATSSESNKAAFSITTNNYTGYTLSISASDDAGTLANGNDSLTSITTNKTLTDTTFDNSDYNGMWGYKPSKYMNGNTVVDNTGTNAVYLISPTTTATTLHVTSAANSTANSYDIALGARADYTKPSGTYSKTFILTAVANKINYSVTYNKNTTDTVTNMPYSNTGNVQSGDTNSTSITLSDLVPAREHYSFLGWCSVTPTTSNGVDSCSGTIYNPNGGGTNRSYGIDQTTLNNGTIYAMWKIDTFTCTKQYKLQNADGTYPDAYTADGSETINYGDTCTYTKTITDYQGDTGNDTARSANQSITTDTTLSLDFPRNTYALTITKNDTYIDSITGAGTYRWGEEVSISATASSGNEFTSWSQTSGTTGTFGSTSSASTTFTMGKGTATIYADGKAGVPGYCATRGVSAADCMQTMTASNCTTTAKTVTDSRDGQAYKVQRLADGKCWMLDNLSLNLTKETIRNALTASNTNATETSLTSLRSGNRTAGIQYASSGFVTWNSSNKSNVFDQAKANATYRDKMTIHYGSGSGLIGVYYNYCAASAGSYCYDEDAAPDGTNASQDICPAGWRMPTGGSSGEYVALLTAYNNNMTATDTGSLQYSLSTPLSGYFASGSTSDQASHGYFWSSTRGSGRLMLSLEVKSSIVYPQYGKYRAGGYSVRCLLQ